MPDGREPIAVTVVGAVAEVEASAWDACAGTDNPFVTHAFLRALEDSGSAAPETGWQPQHLVVKDADGVMAGAAPLYLKNHSYGEYVFDWGWADAFHRAGGHYYPKLQSAVPFTPVTGPRLLVRDGAPKDTAAILAQAMVQLARQHGVSSVHVTFPTEAEWKRLGRMGFLLRTGQQFHWHNRGYNSFDDFLADLVSRKRKAILKERRAMDGHDVTLRTLTGNDITESHWDAFYKFYRNTSDRKWGEAYLTRDFFSRLHGAMGERVVLVMAEAVGRPGGSFVGGALNLIGGDTLYGRYWGCAADYKFLHFEACYYRAIDFAIDKGLTWVEAGAQGPHKIQRGYMPRRTYSAHWIENDSLRRAVADFVASERDQIDREMAYLAGKSPFRDGGPS